MEAKAYAKLNLILNVLGKRPDGYHDIKTVFYALPLFDRVSLVPAEEDRAELTGKYADDPELKEKENIVLRALGLMKKTFGKKDHFCISVEKNIPVAAGLGGGSADAAAVVSLLSKYWHIEDEQALYRVCTMLGADVPFCFAAQNGIRAAVGTGRGEILEYIKLPDFDIELKPGRARIKNKTASVYAELKEEDCKTPFDIEAFLRAKSKKEMAMLMGNQLQAPLERLTGIREDGYILCGAGPWYFRVRL